MKDLTIGIPYFNADKTIDRLLESIGDTRTLIVDDASAVPYEKADHRFEENRGPAAARNWILDNAKTEFVMFADADDKFVDGWEEMVERALKDNPEADAIVFMYTSQRPDKSFDTDPYRQFHDKPFVFGNLYRKSTFDKLEIRFYEQLRYLEDNLFTDMVRRYHFVDQLKLVFHDANIYMHLFNEDAMTNGNPNQITMKANINNTNLGRSIYFNDIIKKKRPIFGPLFRAADMDCLFYMYMMSASMEHDPVVMRSYITALEQLYGDLTIPDERVQQQLMNAQIQGLLQVPTIMFNEWLEQMKS